MDIKNNLLNNTKIKAITDGKQIFPHFLEKEEKNKRGLKLYYYMWLSRLFIFSATIFLLLFLAASLSLFKLAPQVTVEPFLIINQNSSAEMVIAEPIATNMASKEKLMETFVKQYVIYRNSIVSDTKEMQTRWYPGGLIHFLSSEAVFKNFYEPIERDLPQMVSNGQNREVEILSVGKVGGQKSPVWKVDFKTYETSNSSRDSATGVIVPKIRYWTASVTPFFVPERIFTGRRLINHLGFTVYRYNQSEVSF